VKRKKGFYGTASIINDRDSRQVTNLERTASDEPIQTRGGAAFDSQVSIRIASYRIRLADVDGISAKAVLDGLVLAKIIADDTTKEVKEVLFSQTKVKNKTEEKVIVTVERCNHG
jgi:hypothetical protein